jgi:hypothetical protein
LIKTQYRATNAEAVITYHLRLPKRAVTFYILQCYCDQQTSVSDPGATLHYLGLFKKSKSINRKDRKELIINVLTLCALRLLSVLCG